MREWSSSQMRICASVPSASGQCVKSDCHVSLGSSASNLTYELRGRFLGSATTRPMSRRMRWIVETDGAPHPLREHAVDAAGPVVPASGEQAFAHLHDQGAHLVAGAVVHAARPARTRQQSRLALLGMAPAQRVEPLACHAVAPRDARDRFAGPERAHHRHVAVEHAAIPGRQQMTQHAPVPHPRIVTAMARIDWIDVVVFHTNNNKTPVSTKRQPHVNRHADNT